MRPWRRHQDYVIAGLQEKHHYIENRTSQEENLSFEGTPQ